MGRPRIHDASQLLDAAGAIAAAEGPAEVSMARVARATGTPSGSVYHRFPGRAALLGELWLRTVLDFQSGFVAALKAGDPVRGCIAAGNHVITWSRAKPDDARVFLRGPREFAAADWSEGLSERIAAARAELDRALATMATRLPELGPEAHERVLLVCVDVPYGQVRRHLGANGTIPPTAETLVEECARATLLR
ncbi:MAG: TetR/AcrR family transcriptional regulator [Actinomycetota bacterium]|nr:TetR/AcrR family transcriptional regulator [Actinomycetota bacterium]